MYLPRFPHRTWLQSMKWIMYLLLTRIDSQQVCCGLIDRVYVILMAFPLLSALLLRLVPAEGLSVWGLSWTS